MPASEIAVHPTDGPPKQELYLMCDDVEAEVALAGDDLLHGDDDDDRYRGDRRYRDDRRYYGHPGKAKGHYKHKHKHH